MPSGILIQEIQNRGIQIFPESHRSMSHNHGFHAAAKEFGLQVEQSGRQVLFVDPKTSAVVGGLNGMVSSLVSNFSVVATSDKKLTNRILRSYALPVAKQIAFDQSSMDQALDACLDGDLQVVKPAKGAGGAGITVGIKTKEQFLLAWKLAVAAAKPGETILLEEQLPGFDARVVVVNGIFDCAVARIPAHVIGNGMDTVSALVEQKNFRRSKHPHHKRFPIKLSASVAELKPREGEVVYLSKLANIHQGGEALDITDLIGSAVIEVAQKASRAVAGLDVVGIDFALSSLCGTHGMNIIEMNANANFGIHYAPYYGVSRNPARAVVAEILRRNGSQEG